MCVCERQAGRERESGEYDNALLALNVNLHFSNKLLSKRIQLTWSLYYVTVSMSQEIGLQIQKQLCFQIGIKLIQSNNIP